MKYSVNSCPNCKSFEYFPNSKISSNPLGESLSFKDLAESWRGFFKTKPFLSYYRCKKCKLLYARQYSILYKRLPSLYKNMLHNMDDVDITLLDKTQSYYYKILKKYISSRDNYLEIGADIGLFLNKIKENTPFSKYWIYEPNELSHEKLLKVLNLSNYYLSKEMNHLNKITSCSIDIAVMIHIVDHLVNPLERLSEIRKKLKKNGKLMIVCHDENSLLRKIFRSKWPAFCLQHPQIFNKNTLTNILENAGYIVVERRKSKNYFDMEFLLNNLIWALGIRKIIKSNLLKKISFGLKLGNILFIAKKSPHI